MRNSVRCPCTVLLNGMAPKVVAAEFAGVGGAENIFKIHEAARGEFRAADAE